MDIHRELEVKIHLSKLEQGNESRLLLKQKKIWYVTI